MAETPNVTNPVMVPALMGALPPPPGVKPNFVDPENFHPAMIATIVFCLALTTLLTVARVYTKLFISKTHGWDDYTYVVGWLGLVGYCAVGLAGIQYGDGVHQWNVTLQDMVNFIKLASTNEVYYACLIFITKLSILLQYLRIFVPNRQGIAYYAAHALIWLNLICYTIIGFLVLFQCTPRRKIWEPLLPGNCLNFGSILISGAIINIVSDFCILALPLASIWNLQMATKHKIGISAVFAVGLFACISSIMRLILSISANHSKDVTWELVKVYLWTVAEITSALICASLPVLPQFFRYSLPKITSYFQSSTQRKSSSQGTPNNRRIYAGSSTPRKPSSGVWHDLREMRPNGTYVEFDNSETAALATRGASADNKAGPPGTPPGKEPWDGPIVKQTDLESGASISD